MVESIRFVPGSAAVGSLVGAALVVMVSVTGFAGAATISGVSPGSGTPGTVVTIYGSGFTDPAAVTCDCLGVALEVIAVSGTELVARFPASGSSCEPCSGAFTVTLLESGQTTSGGSFQYQGSQNGIYYVDPTVIDVVGGGSSPSAISIWGSGFSATVIVEINGWRVSSDDISVLDSGTIEVVNLPGPDVLGIEWEVATCDAGAGEEGERYLQTGADLTVINIPSWCTDTLVDGLVFNPEDSSCRTMSSNLVFLDGFESGDLDSWTTVIN